MNGLINMVGSGEYLPVMQEVDRYLLDSLSLDGRPARVACLATAAGKEGESSINRWLTMGVRHFRDLDTDVEAVRIVDRVSANDPHWEPILENADLIYFSGGDPSYLYETMKDSRGWRAAQRAWARGAIYAGCSAGAMILSKRMPNFRRASTEDGFGIVPATYIVPHFDATPGVWRPLIARLTRELKPGERLIGVDENTALIGKLNGDWIVKGQGAVQIFECDGQAAYTDGQTLMLP